MCRLLRKIGCLLLLFFFFLFSFTLSSPVLLQPRTLFYLFTHDWFLCLENSLPTFWEVRGISWFEHACLLTCSPGEVKEKVGEGICACWHLVLASSSVICLRSAGCIAVCFPVCLPCWPGKQDLWVGLCLGFALSCEPSASLLVNIW